MFKILIRSAFSGTVYQTEPGQHCVFSFECEKNVHCKKTGIFFGKKENDFFCVGGSDDFSLFHPTTVRQSSEGFVFVNDFGNRRILKIDPQNLGKTEILEFSVENFPHVHPGQVENFRFALPLQSFFTPRKFEQEISLSAKEIALVKNFVERSELFEMPKKVFQTWASKNLPEKMKAVVENLKRENSQFEHFFFDDFDCRNFIKNHFSDRVLKAYDEMVPGGYKVDLWRLAVVFVHGGIYLEIKYHPINGFKLDELLDGKNHLELDRPPPMYIHNAVMAFEKGHPLLLKAIFKIVQNVEKRHFGTDPLVPTGPGMWNDLLREGDLKPNVDLAHSRVDKHIFFNGRLILKEYEGYREDVWTERQRGKATGHYDELWRKGQIYGTAGTDL